jgi:ferredoxin--NADP+ reductase
VEAVRLELNTLTGDAFHQSVRGTGKIVELEAGAVFRSIGYRGVPVPGIPFKPARGVIPNAGGRIIDEHGRPLPGLYVTGWIKRGPSGIIGTNRADSVATVNPLLGDLAAARLVVLATPGTE